MRTIRVEPETVTIWISGEELPEREEVLALVRRSLAEEGFDPWEQTEAECFEAGRELLVIARPAPARQAAFFLPSVESLVAFAEAAPEAEGSVYAARRGYIWTMPPSSVRPGMYDFAEPQTLHPMWEVHAREQGRCIIPENAGQVLRQSFRQD